MNPCTRTTLPPPKQKPQNLGYLHCSNKGNETWRELLTASTTDCTSQYQADNPAEAQSHVHDGLPAAGPSGAQLLEVWWAGSPKRPTTSPSLPILLPHQLVRMSRAVPQGSTPLIPFKFEFSIYSDLLLVWGQFPTAHSCSSATAHPCRPFSKACLLPSPTTTQPMFFYKMLFLCHGTNILKCHQKAGWAWPPQPALTLLVHSETARFQVFS